METQTSTQVSEAPLHTPHKDAERDAEVSLPVSAPRRGVGPDEAAMTSLEVGGTPSSSVWDGLMKAPSRTEQTMELDSDDCMSQKSSSSLPGSSSQPKEKRKPSSRGRGTKPHEQKPLPKRVLPP